MLNNSKQAIIALALSLSGMCLSATSLVPVSNEKGKWGFADEAGKQVVGYKYDMAQGFENGRALVKKGDNFGMIDENAKEVIPVRYNIIERHSSGIYRVAANGKYKNGVLLDEKYGFVSSDGKELLKPEYDEIGQFKNGIAYIKKGNLYGYVNDRIEAIVPCKYNLVGAFNDEGFVWVAEGAKPSKESSEYTGGKCGIYDRQGRIIVEPKFKSIGSFCKYMRKFDEEQMKKMSSVERTTLKESGSHHLYRKIRITKKLFEKLPDETMGFYASNDEQGYKNSVVGKSGEIIIKEGKYHTPFYPTDGWALISEKKGYNYLNLATSKMMFKKPVSDAWAFDEGVAVIDRDGHGMELIDTEGNTVSSAYDYIYPKNEGVYIVKSGSESNMAFGAIDKTGREVIAARQKALFPPVNGMMACNPSGQKGGYIGTDGKWIIEPKYKSVHSFKRGLAWVNTSEGCGLIDPQGNQVVKCVWQNSKIHYEGQPGFLWVTDEKGSDAGYMLLRISDNKILTDKKYKWCRMVGSDFDDVAFCGHDDNHLGVIDNTGKEIIPMEFTYRQAVVAYRYLQTTGRPDWEEFDTYRVKLYSNPERNKGRLNTKLSPSMWDY